MRKMIEAARGWHRPLMGMVAVMAVLAVVAGVGILVDDRELLGESVWVKPAKFAVSFAVYGATLAWLLSRLGGARRLGWWLGTVFAVTGVVDVGFIAIQAARGTFSHFNANADTFNQVGQQVFSSGVMGLFGASLVIAVVLLFQRVGDSASTWALRAGVTLAVAGMGVAFYLVGYPYDEPYQVRDAYGRTVEMHGQHGVGNPTGDGMFLTNWNATGGDLRVPHFVGMHGVQVLLVVAGVLSLLAVRTAWLRDEKVRARLVCAAAFAQTGLLAVTTWQAARDQSLIRPDGATLTALAVVAAVTALLVLATVSTARRKHGTPRVGAEVVAVQA